MEKIDKDNIEEVIKNQKEYYDNLSPKEKKKLRRDSEKTKNLLEHCKVQTEYGFDYKANKIDLEKFMFLQKPDLNKPVNENLIRNLAFISRKNIILRYLLIEAGLKDDRIEKILRNTLIDDKKHFYQIYNNPQKFYDESYFVIDGEFRLSGVEVDFYLSKYGLFKPADISRKIIEKKIERKLNKKVRQFINKFSESFHKEITAILSDRKNTPSPTEYFQQLKLSLTYFFKDVVENQFNVKHRKYYSAYFISYLNEMYWLNEQVLDKTLDMYFNPPNFLLSIAEGEKQVAKLVFNYKEKIDKQLKEVKKLVKNKEEILTNIENRNRTYDIKVFRKAKEIYESNRGKKPKTTHAEALVLANNELGVYSNESLRDNNGFDTDFFSSMQTSFRRQYKSIY